MTAQRLNPLLKIANVTYSFSFIDEQIRCIRMCDPVRSGFHNCCPAFVMIKTAKCRKASRE